MGWLTHEAGWPHAFFFMSDLGTMISFMWLRVIHDPNNHPDMSRKELGYIAEGGALINMDWKSNTQKVSLSVKVGQIRRLVGSRMTTSIYIGQCCVNILTHFFITQFPVHLMRARGMSTLKADFVTSVPAVRDSVGEVLGEVISDWLIHCTGSLNIARKTPITLGILFSITMLMRNCVSMKQMVIGFMVTVFFGEGIGTPGWVVMADAASEEISSLSGGLFDIFSNISGIAILITIDCIIGTTGLFSGAPIYIGIHALVVIPSYLVLVGDIKRIELKPAVGRSSRLSDPARLLWR